MGVVRYFHPQRKEISCNMEGYVAATSVNIIELGVTFHLPYLPAMCSGCPMVVFAAMVFVVCYCCHVLLLFIVYCQVFALVRYTEDPQRFSIEYSDGKISRYTATDR